MPVFRVAKVSGQVSWSNGQPFDGFALFGIVMPTDGASPWPKITTEAGADERLPVWFVIPISQGRYSQNAGLIYTEDINPPNTLYTAYYYDRALKRLLGPTSFFSVSGDFSYPQTIPAPTAGSTAPSPDG